MGNDNMNGSVESGDTSVENTQDNTEKSKEQNANTQGSQKQTTQGYQSTGDYESIYPSAKEEKLEELMYSNPTEFIKKMRNEAKELLTREIEKRDNEKVFWDQFYTENSDLKKYRRIVDVVVREKESTLKDLVKDRKVDEVKNLLKSETHAILNLARSGNENEVELSKDSTHTFSSSGTQAPPAEKKTEATDFVTQIRNFQRRKK